MPVGAAISAGASLLGSAATSSAAQSAAKDQATASANNLAFEKQIYNTGQQQLTPDINEGNSAGSALAGLLGTGGDPAASSTAFKDYLGSTNYQFQLGQGENAIGFANAPALTSGGTAKALNNYAQGQAGSALQGYEGLLAGQQGLGVNAALGLAGVGENISGLAANANNLAAGANGSAALTGASSVGSALGNLSSLANQSLTQSSFGSAAGTLAGNTAGSALGALAG